MSGIPDLELAPDGDFADRLEQVLLAEMGWETDAIVRPRSAEPARPVAPSRRFGTATAATLVAAAVIGLLFVNRDDSKPGTPVVTAVPTTAPTTIPPTTATPPATDGVLPGMPIAKPLPAGTRYRLGRSVLGRSLEITNSVEGAWGQWDTGGFVLTTSADGNEVLIGAFDLARARFFTDPLVNASSLLDDAALMAATSEAPADFLAYFAALPGVEAGDVIDTQFGGQPAQAMSWTFGAFEGGSPCRPSGNCVNTIWFPGTRAGSRFVSSYTSGYAGTVYLLDLDGHSVVFEVQDRPGARQAADSLVIGD